MKQILLHIGTHKTGTTSIQAFCRQNKAQLERLGYLYPETGLVGNAHHSLAVDFLDEHYCVSKSSDFRLLYQQLTREIDALACDKIILSSEAFRELLDDAEYRLTRPEEIKRRVSGIFEELAGRYELKMVLFLRRHDHYLQSIYAELVRLSDETRTLPEFISDKEPTYTELIACAADCYKIKNENILISPFEKQQFVQGSLIKTFLRQIGIDRLGGFQNLDLEINTRSSLHAVEYKRLINLLNLSRKESLFIKQCLIELDKRGVLNDVDRYGLLSPHQRIEIITRHLDEYSRIARSYLNRNDGVLFRDPLPDPDEPFEKYPGLSCEKSTLINAWISYRMRRNADKLNPPPADAFFSKLKRRIPQPVKKCLRAMLGMTNRQLHSRGPVL